MTNLQWAGVIILGTIASTVLVHLVMSKLDAIFEWIEDHILNGGGCGCLVFYFFAVAIVVGAVLAVLGFGWPMVATIGLIVGVLLAIPLTRTLN
ncbi:hypothetical protein [Granulicoccus sp. GXG6511]|uniref:hypothetical protein n=1 Tax=Granulicoccus sp. GXG6511 TaxID=3381351 RepID=UPI003D7DD938